MPETPIFSPAGRDCNALVAPRLLIPLLSGAAETMVSIQGFFSSSSSTSSYPLSMSLRRSWLGLTLCGLNVNTLSHTLFKAVAQTERDSAHPLCIIQHSPLITQDNKKKTHYGFQSLERLPLCPPPRTSPSYRLWEMAGEAGATSWALRLELPSEGGPIPGPDGCGMPGELGAMGW